MIPRDEEFDVYVLEGVFVEVWRGQRLSAAQQFGVDWDGPVHSIVHAAAFCPPAGALAVPASDPLPWVPWWVRVWRAARPLVYVLFAWGAGMALLYGLGRVRGWW
ncbi:MAG: hypothetical protein LAN84_00335 [Acidobacteriia bacterium]|nr:hypothetical protein [Terriglobia bacterium]